MFHRTTLLVGTAAFAWAMASAAVAYPGGTPAFQTDAAPFCAPCHSSTSAEMLDGAPGERATKELAENKHVAAILAGSGAYETMSEADREQLAAHVRAVDAASAVSLTAPPKVKAGETFTVTVDVTGGAGPVVGIGLVDTPHRWRARPAPGAGFFVTKAPTVLGQDFQEQTEWLAARGDAQNLAFVNVKGIRSDAVAGDWGRAQVVWSLRAPDDAGKHPLTAVYFYGTEKASPLGIVEDPLRGKMLRGGTSGASGRIRFAETVTIEVTP